MLTFSAERAKVWGINIKNRTNNKGGYIHRFRKSQLTIPDPPPKQEAFFSVYQCCLSLIIIQASDNVHMLLWSGWDGALRW